MPSHYIEDTNLSHAWARALKEVVAPGHKEVVPLVVSVTGFDDEGDVIEDPQIRTALDAFLAAQDLQKIDTVAGTLFPRSFWNPNAGRAQLFQRYEKAFPRIQKASGKNRRGVYFKRMISGGIAANPNQLDFIIGEYLSRDAVRRSMLQVCVFDPTKDHSRAAQLGFPCLQHVTFSPVGDSLSVNAFYATQFIVERAYGNYLGLCWLGKFAAHEMGLKLKRVTCYSGISELDMRMTKTKIAPLLTTINQVLTPQTGV